MPSVRVMASSVTRSLPHDEHWAPPRAPCWVSEPSGTGAAGATGGTERAGRGPGAALTAWLRASRYGAPASLGGGEAGAARHVDAPSGWRPLEPDGYRHKVHGTHLSMRRFRDKPDTRRSARRVRERAGPAGGRAGPRRGARSPRPRPRRSRRGGRHAGRLADRVGQRLEVVAGRQQRLGVRGEPQDLPAAGGGEPAAVLLAEVVAVRLGVRRQRAEDRRRVGVDVGQRGHGRTPAGGPRTASDQAHAGEE